MELLIPENDCPNPIVSLVVPALNEKITIGTFVDWCHEGLKNAGISGEVLIVDSSTDETPQIAQSKGARVLRVPKRGLGQAYVDALPYIRGKFVIMGDCDCTYDFRQIQPFVEEFNRGVEFVMGSRIKGEIEPGSMPALHRFFGTPLTTWILNFLYGCDFSDIHCGMRGITRDGYARLNLQSKTWEYASEMIIKAVSLNMRVSEAPIRFFKDRDGRLSHLKRNGWTAPWIAGWQTLRAFFLYRPSFFLRIPGYLCVGLGFLLIFSLTMGPLHLGSIELSLHSQIFGLFIMALGLGFQQLDAVTCLYLAFEKERCQRLRAIYVYDRVVPVAAIVVVSGLLMGTPFVFDWIRNGMKLFSLSYVFVASLGVTLIGFHLFIKSLTINVLSLKSEGTV